MKKKHLGLALGLALMTSLSVCSAENTDLFSDVPEGHWAYEAVSTLARDGILTGYDNGSFQGDRAITRYEMAQMIANARTHQAGASESDSALINELSEEFNDELNALGVRVQRLEKSVDNVRISGSFAQKYSKKNHPKMANSAADSKTDSTLWEKELILNLDADIPKTDLAAHVVLKTSFEADSFNSEEDAKHTWNNGHERSDCFRPDQYYVGGPIGHTGIETKVGTFAPDVQHNFIENATLRGMELRGKAGKFDWQLLAGRTDYRDDKSDEPIVYEEDASRSTSTSSVVYNEGTSTEGDASKWAGNGAITDANGNYYRTERSTTSGTTYYKEKTTYNDFVRYSRPASSYAYTSNKTSYTKYGSKNWGWFDVLESTETGYESGEKATDHVYNQNEHKDLYAISLGYNFSPKAKLSLAEYRYKSGAYETKPLLITAATLDGKVSPFIYYSLLYAHGNQDGNDKAYSAELGYNGTSFAPSTKAHEVTAYAAYRKLGPDAIVQSSFEDGADEGQKGIEAGLFYNFTDNCQYLFKYFKGESLTHNNDDRSKLFSSLTIAF